MGGSAAMRQFGVVGHLAPHFLNLLGALPTRACFNALVSLGNAQGAWHHQQKRRSPRHRAGRPWREMENPGCVKPIKKDHKEKVGQHIPRSLHRTPSRGALLASTDMDVRLLKRIVSKYVNKLILVAIISVYSHIVASAGLVASSGLVAASALSVWSLWATVTTEPGRIPREWPWDPEAERPGQRRRVGRERKRWGGVRFDRRAMLFKPDRSHYCNRLGACILRMDHYCPWIDTTIGFHNHKPFVLFLLYAAASARFALSLLAVEASGRGGSDPCACMCGWAMTMVCWGSILVVARLPILGHIFGHSNPLRRVSWFVVWGSVILLFLCPLVAALWVPAPVRDWTMVLATSICGGLLLFLEHFACLHLYYVLINTTTIEYLEKKHLGAGGERLYPYNCGWLRNIGSVFGPNWLAWWLPVSSGFGQRDGLYFVRNSNQPASSGERIHCADRKKRKIRRLWSIALQFAKAEARRRVRAKVLSMTSVLEAFGANGLSRKLASRIEPGGLPKTDMLKSPGNSMLSPTRNYSLDALRLLEIPAGQRSEGSHLGQESDDQGMAQGEEVKTHVSSKGRRFRFSGAQS